MKLFLSSYYLGDEPIKFADLCGDVKVAVIMNAADLSVDYQSFTDKVIASLNGIGLEAYEFDLREYFDDNAKLQNDLANYGAVWVAGGNSFVVLRAMYQSGFAEEVTRRIKNYTLVYGGFSAGAVVAAQTLKGIELVDDADEVPTGYNSEPIWDGLGLYDYSIAPHYNSDHPESDLVNDVVEYFKEHRMPYKTLRDGEVIIVNT